MKSLLLVLAMALGMPALADPAVLRPINELRVAQGHAPMTYVLSLENAALLHAIDMAQWGYFAHEGRDGSSVGQRVTAQGYEWCLVAENIAKGQRSLSQVMQDWAESPGHLANMIRPELREIGVARGPGHLWVMVLAAPC